MAQIIICSLLTNISGRPDAVVSHQRYSEKTSGLLSLTSLIKRTIAYASIRRDYLSSWYPPRRMKPPVNKSSHSAEQVLNKGAESKEASAVSVTLSTHIQVHKVDLIKREYFWTPATSQMVEESVNTSEGKCEK